jgi:hypothetical protein
VGLKNASKVPGFTNCMCSPVFSLLEHNIYTPTNLQP